MGHSQSKTPETIEDLVKKANDDIAQLQQAGVIDRFKQLVDTKQYDILYQILKSDTNMSPCEISYFMEVTLEKLTTMPL
jgi:flavin-binding protein dodecin